MSSNNVYYQFNEAEEAEEELHNVSLYFVLFAFMLAAVFVSTKFLKDSAWASSYLSEPALTLLIGSFVGGSIWVFLPDFEPQSAEYHGEYQDNVLAHSLLSFSPNVFFMALLPPIIFNSGYQVRRELFYLHIKPIVLFAGLGTVLCTLVTAFLLYNVSLLGWFGNMFHPSLLELLAFGSLIAATDTVSVLGTFQAKRVDPHLFYLVFGESALNDAVALISFTTFSDLLLRGEDFSGATSIFLKVAGFILQLMEQAILSPLLGIVFSFAAALIFKYVDLRQHPSAELPLYMLLMYTPFVLAECFHLSGIVTIFFSGISARRYIAPNVSSATRRNADVLFKLTANIAEICIFLELGLSVFGLPGSFNWSFIAWSSVGSLLGRAIGIYPLAMMYNWCLKKNTYHSNGPDSQLDASESDKAPPEFTNVPGQRKSHDKYIPLQMVHMIWFAGLRGAVAYACVRKFPNVSGHADTFTATTMVIVLLSVIGMGGTTECMLQVLGIDVDVDEEEYMREWRKRRRLKGKLHELGKSYRRVVASAFTKNLLLGRKQIYLRMHCARSGSLSIRSFGFIKRLDRSK